MFPFLIQFALLGRTVAFGPYTLFLSVAVVFAVAGCFLFALKRKFSRGKVLLVLFAMLFSALIGARLLNALIHADVYAKNPGQLFALTTSGFSLYGGMLMAAAAGYLCCRILKINPFKLGDTFVPFLGISIAIVRVGCFLHGCCFGKETHLPWGVIFPLGSPAHLYQMSLYGNLLDVRPVHPTQLYELAAALLISVFCFYVLKKKWADGTALIIFLVGFSLFRLFDSFLRVDPEPLTVSPYFYPAIYLSLVSFGLLLFFLRLMQKGSLPADGETLAIKIKENL